MNDYAQNLKLLAFNFGSWGTTIASIGVAKDLMQMACLLASFSLSIASIWWIRKQSANMDKRDKEAKE
jgi:hypothetical protein